MNVNVKTISCLGRHLTRLWNKVNLGFLIITFFMNIFSPSLLILCFLRSQRSPVFKPSSPASKEPQNYTTSHFVTNPALLPLSLLLSKTLFCTASHPPLTKTLQHVPASPPGRTASLTPLWSFQTV